MHDRWKPRVQFGLLDVTRAMDKFPILAIDAYLKSLQKYLNFKKNPNLKCNLTKDSKLPPIANRSNGFVVATQPIIVDLFYHMTVDIMGKVVKVSTSATANPQHGLIVRLVIQPIAYIIKMEQVEFCY